MKKIAYSAFLFLVAGLLSQSKAATSSTMPYDENARGDRTFNIGGRGYRGFSIGDSTFTVINARVGISTNNPAALLEIVRSVSDTAFRIVGYDQSPFIDLRRACGPSSAPAACGSNQILGQISARGFADNDFADGSRAAIRMRTDETWSDSAQGTHIRLATTQNGTTSRTDKVIVDNDGRVGIGDMSPDATLDVAGDLLVEDGITGSSTATFAGNGALGIQVTSGPILNPNNGGLQIGQNGGFPNAVLGVAGTHGSGYAVIISTSVESNAPSFVMENDGDIGIGTTSPTSKLEVFGGFTLGSRTISELESNAPGKAGEMWYCSDCLNAVHVVVGTGTAVSQWDSFTGGTAWH